MAAFFLQQIRVESQAEEEALESGCLPEEESLQAGQASLPRLAAVEAAGLPGELRDVEKPQPLPSESLRLHQLPSRNTIAAVAGK